MFVAVAVAVGVLVGVAVAVAVGVLVAVAVAVGVDVGVAVGVTVGVAVGVGGIATNSAVNVKSHTGSVISTNIFALLLIKLLHPLFKLASTV